MKSTSFIFVQILLFSFALISCNNRSNADNKQNYYYEPTVSVISGTIKVEPCLYADDSVANIREDSYILNLEKSINVISNFDTTKISKIQLTFNPDEVKVQNYKNKKVRLTGTFFGWDNGHHHTPVLINVNKIELK